MNRMEALEHDIAEIQERLAARSDLINREVESVGPMVGLVDSARAAATTKQGRISRATQEHPIASALSALSTFYVAAQESGLVDRIAGSARRAKVKAELKYAENRHAASHKSADTGGKVKAKARQVQADFSERYDDVATSVGDASDDAAAQGRIAYAKSKSFVEQNPVAVGLLAAGVGAAAASFLMMGRKEETKVEPLPRAKAPVVKRRPRAASASRAAPAKPVTAAPAAKPSTAAKSAKRGGTAKAAAATSKASKKTEATRHLQKPATKRKLPASKLNGSATGGPANTASTTARPVDEILRG